ncbi:hypothetical protein [Comamonas odontotermitis]|uniref:hypothetical protein n=1 Tax=Comamonas odontotermitis TaxID=379895 RepID=UPI003753DD91
MSLIARWLGKSSKLPARAEAAQPSVFAESLRTVQHNPQAVVPLVAPHATDTAPRPGERSARREMVYSSVRESMVRSGILSAGYKFKVLALDKRATQFIVMVDLAEEFSVSPEKLSQIEALIAYSAKTRFEILVTSVYWRLNGQLGASSVKAKPASTSAPGAAGIRAGVRPARAGAAGMAAAPVAGIDPIEEVEIEAFKKALIDAATRPVPALNGDRQPAPAATRPAPIVPVRTSAAQHVEAARQAARQGGVPAPTPDTNFGGLSTTQYGDLN